MHYEFPICDKGDLFQSLEKVLFFFGYHYGWSEIPFSQKKTFAKFFRTSGGKQLLLFGMDKYEVRRSFGSDEASL